MSDQDLSAEIVRLRGLLRLLEGKGSPDGDKSCPVCYTDANHYGPLDHEPDCWLAAELAKELHAGQAIRPMTTGGLSDEELYDTS